MPHQQSQEIFVLLNVYSFKKNPTTLFEMLYSSDIFFLTLQYCSYTLCIPCLEKLCEQEDNSTISEDKPVEHDQ